MKLLTEEHKRRLLANGRWNQEKASKDMQPEDFRPIVKFFCSWGPAAWLLTELDPEDPDIAFGLCDLGFGEPELGSVRLSELESVQGPDGLRIERDRWFRAAKTLSAYAAEAQTNGRIRA